MAAASGSITALHGSTRSGHDTAHIAKAAACCPYAKLSPFKWWIPTHGLLGGRLEWLPELCRFARVPTTSSRMGARQ
eukprot:5397722-Prorocentrum_lima.AAC.1